MTANAENTVDTCEMQAEELVGTAAVRRICFVCTGNTCRSPMAAAAANYLLGKKGIRAVSAGIATNGGSPISPNAVAALTAAGIEPDPAAPYTAHVSRPADAPLLGGCERIIGLTAAHAMALMTAFPSLAGRICSFPCDIADPFGQSEEVYRECLAQIIAGIKEMFPSESAG